MAANCSCLQDVLFKCFEIVQRNEIHVRLDLEPGQADLVWEEVGDFFDLRWLFGTRKLVLAGDPKVPGATRTYSSGGVEKLLSFDEEGRKLTWDLNRFPEYEGGIQVNDGALHFWIKGRVPQQILHRAEVTVKSQLEAVLWIANQRTKMSKVCIVTTTIPLSDPQAYAKIVQEFEKPALRALMAQGDVLQLRLDLDEATRTVRAYEVWRDPETCTRHLYESSFAALMGKLRPLLDSTRLKELEIHNWGDFENCPKFKEKINASPKILHPTQECTVSLFRTALDTNRDNVVLTDELLLRPDVAGDCETLLRRLKVIALDEARHDQLLDVRFHLDKKNNKLSSFQVFTSALAFERIVLNGAPYGQVLEQLKGLGQRPARGSVWGPVNDRIRAFFRDSAVTFRNAKLCELLSHRDRDETLVEIPGQVPYFPDEQKQQVHALLHRLDHYTTTMLDLLPRRTWSMKQTLLQEPFHLKEPHLKGSKEDHIKMGGLPFTVCKTDDYFGDQELMDKLVFTTVSNGTLFPLHDKLLDVPDELVDCMKHELLFDKIIPPPHHCLMELSSDVAMERMITSGVASLWLKDHEGGFKVDYSCMGKLQPRGGFRTLGATAYLDADCKLTGIHVTDGDRLYSPGEAGWEDAKMVFRTSAAQWNTAVDHLAGVHMVATNPVITAAVQHLPTEHSVRRLLQPFSFRSVYVNQRAVKSLLDPHSIVLHACGYDVENFGRLLEMGVQTCELWLPPPERITRAGHRVQGLVNAQKFSYGEDSIGLYRIFEHFIKEWVEDEYSSDEQVRADHELQAFAKDLHSQTKVAAFGTPERFESRKDLVRCIATFCTNATGMHEYVGTVQEYIAHPSFMGFRARPNSGRVDMQAWLLGMLLFSVTSLPMPQLMDDFSGCYTREAEKQRWQRCLSRLQEQTRRIRDANSQRTYPFKSFSPDVLECSVNV